MKFLIFLILSISSIILLNTYGQAGNPPANVTKSFTQKFPAAQSIKWFKEVKVFKAVFKEDGIHYEAVMGYAGSAASAPYSSL